MATAPGSTDPLAVASWDAPDSAGERSKSDRYLARRLAAAGADVKGVAVATFVLAAAVAVAAWVAVGVVVEHWLVPGGLSVAVRWAWLAAGLAALAAAAIRWLLPFLRYRVNLVYAARAIEHEHPDLHNDIVNAVLVKSRPEAAPALVVRSLERRAAKRLSGVTADGVIDRTPALWLAVALAALVAAACVYELCAPKSLLVSAARLLAPWAPLAAPSRVTIDPPRLAWRLPAVAAAPGGERTDHELPTAAATATLVRGRQLVVACDIRGLRAGEPATLAVTPIRDDGTLDPAAVPWQVPLVVAGGAGRHAAVLPDATRGLQHSVDLLVTAGDAPARNLRVTVVDVPSLLVREVRYDYPDYTRREPEIVAWQGDVRAVEGTRVTIVAEGNRPLKAAWIDKGCDGSKDVQLRINAQDPTRATGSFTLRLDADAAATAGSYRLVFEPRGSSSTDREETVVERLEHRIEVLPDLAPEVSIEEPREQVVLVPPDAPVGIRVRALDPDFGLARVGLETRLGGGPTQPETVIFRGTRPGEFAGVTEIVPARLGAAAGSTIEYRAVAADTKPDPANVAHSPWKVLRVEAGVPPRAPVPPPDGGRDRQREPSPADGDAPRGDAGGEGRADVPPRDRGTQDRQDPGEETPSEERQAGGAEEAGDQAAGKQSGGKDGGEAQGRGEQAGAKQAGGPSGDEQQAGEQQADTQPGAGEQQGGDQEEGEREGAEQQAGRQSGGAEEAGTQQAGDQRGSERQDGTRQQPGEQAGEQQAGSPPREGEQQGQGGQRQPGDRQQGVERQAGGQQAGDRQRGAGEAGARREAVSADGTNDGEAVERILEQRREHVLQKTSQSGAVKVEKTKQGQATDVQQQQEQNLPGMVRQTEDQKGPVDVGQQLDANAHGIEQQQRQNLAGQTDQEQEQKGPSNVNQSLEATVKDVRQQQDQEQRAEVRQKQSQQLPSDINQKLKGNVDHVEQQQSQDQRGEISQNQRQSQPTNVDQQLEGDFDHLRQQQQVQRGKHEQQAEQKQLSEIERQVNRRQASPSRQNDSDAGGQSDVRQETQNQGGPGQSIVSQSQQEQQAGGQTLVGQGQQQQAQQGQSVVTQSQQSQVQQGQGLVGQAQQHQEQPHDGPPPASELEWTEQDRTHARNAADLAIEHLRDSLGEGRRDVLDALGWTPEQARAFLDRWQAIRRLAGSSDARERGEYDRALRSLGLRPSGVTSSREVPADAPGGQAEGRRTRPPASYREQFQAYQQGTNGE